MLQLLPQYQTTAISAAGAKQSRPSLDSKSQPLQQQQSSNKAAGSSSSKFGSLSDLVLSISKFRMSPVEPSGAVSAFYEVAEETQPNKLQGSNPLISFINSKL